MDLGPASGRPTATAMMLLKETTSPNVRTSVHEALLAMSAMVTASQQQTLDMLAMFQKQTRDMVTGCQQQCQRQTQQVMNNLSREMMGAVPG